MLTGYHGNNFTLTVFDKVPDQNYFDYRGNKFSVPSPFPEKGDLPQKQVCSLSASVRAIKWSRSVCGFPTAECDPVAVCRLFLVYPLQVCLDRLSLIL